MNTQVNKTHKNNSRRVTNNSAEKQGSGEPTNQLVDNRSEVIAQKKLQMIANISPQVQQLKKIQELTNSDRQDIKTAQLEDFTEGNPGRIAQRREYLDEQKPLHNTSEAFQKNDSKTGLPENFKSGIEHISGSSMENKDHLMRAKAIGPPKKSSSKPRLPKSSPVDSATCPAQRYYRHGDMRIADDGKMAVLEESITGSQEAYATRSLIVSSSAALQSANSPIKLEPGTLKGKAYDKDGENPQYLADVVPVNTIDGSKDTGMNLWADCGRSAKMVSGMENTPGKGDVSPVARYQKGGQQKKGKYGEWMEIQKVRIMMDLFTTKSEWWQIFSPKYKSKLNLKALNSKIKAYDQTKAKWLAEPDKESNAALMLQNKMNILAKQLDEMSRVEYGKLEDDAKDAFDKAAGINMYADPEIGEAFHVSTGGGEHPDKDPDDGTWNFHWAAVVIKAADDSMTLENYSVGEYSKKNTDWVFQIYGVGKKGQSAHEEHRDVHKQHGDAPTTMVATKK